MLKYERAKEKVLNLNETKIKLKKKVMVPKSRDQNNSPYPLLTYLYETVIFSRSPPKRKVEITPLIRRKKQ